MRSLVFLTSAVALTACSTSPQPSSYGQRQEAKLQQLLAGKVAGPEQDCLATIRTHDMVRIDDDTVLFRDGSRRIYRNELIGSCNGLGSQNYTLVTNSFGSSGGRLCRGDIARTVDLSSGMSVGSCALGSFVPYTAPRG